MNESWLEPVLREHLRPVAYGSSGFESRTHFKPVYAKPARLNLAWVGLAALTVVLSVVGLRFYGPSRSLEFESSNPAAIQAWVKQNTGLEVPFPAHFSASVRLFGAHRVNSGVEVAYSVNGRMERLQIARMDAPLPGHRTIERSAKLISWSMGGQTYSVPCASPEDAQAACILCHAGGIL